MSITSFAFLGFGYNLRVRPAIKSSNAADRVDPILRNRIRQAIDSADRVEAAMLLAEARMSGGIVPIAAISRYCDGDGFLAEYYELIDVAEVGGCFYVNFRQFKELNAQLVQGATRRELKNVGKKYKKKRKKLTYTKDGVTITLSGNADRLGQKWYFRKQIEGVRRYFILGHDRTASHKLATEIVADHRAKMPLLDLLKKYKAESPEIEYLEVKAKRKAALGAGKSSESASTDLESGVTLMQLMAAYQEGSKNRTSGLTPKNARRCVNQLRKVISLALNLKLPKNTTTKEIEAAEKRAFERPVSDLTPEMVDIFMDKMLGVGDDYDDIDEVEILERSESANSSFRQAKSIFSRKGQKIFRRAGLAFELPAGFLYVGFLPVTHGIYTLPEFHRIEGIFEELRTLRKKDPRHYLARLIGLYVNLRPKEIIHLRKEQIQYSGYWKVEIRVRADFKPKHYHERTIKIPTGLAEHIMEICRDNGSDYVISGGNRSELFRPFNEHLHNTFLPDAGRPSYELRKFYASASNLAVGLKTTRKRMGHKNATTTEDHYIDKDTSQALVDLYEKHAKELFGDVAFPK